MARPKAVGRRGSPKKRIKNLPISIGTTAAKVATAEATIGVIRVIGIAAHDCGIIATVRVIGIVFIAAAFAAVSVSAFSAIISAAIGFGAAVFDGHNKDKDKGGDKDEG